MTLRTETNFFKDDVGLLLSNEAKENFQRSVDVSLEQIRSTDVGSSLLGEIAQARHEVVIVRAARSVGNKCRQKDDSTKGRMAACYKEVLKYESLVPKVLEQEAQHPARKKFMKFCAPNDNGGQQGEYRYKKETGFGLLAHKKDEAQKQVEINNPNSVSALQRGLIAYHIMDKLTPGPGTKAEVLWDPSLLALCEDLSADRRAAWMDRPPWVALAHELIHAWRLVTGRCVFQPGGIEEYWEEAMTVGLPPYDGCRFTENRLRHAKALPLRNFYAESTLNRSKAAATKHGEAKSRLPVSFLIKVVGSGPADPLVFNYDIRSAGKPDEVVSGKTDAQGRANAIAKWMADSEIRFRGFGALGRVETQWQKILISRSMTLQFGRYSFICEPLYQ